MIVTLLLSFCLFDNNNSLSGDTNGSGAGASASANLVRGGNNNSFGCDNNNESGTNANDNSSDTTNGNAKNEELSWSKLTFEKFISFLRKMVCLSLLSFSRRALW